MPKHEPVKYVTIEFSEAEVRALVKALGGPGGFAYNDLGMARLKLAQALPENR